MKHFTQISFALWLATIVGCSGNSVHSGGSGLIEADQTVVSAETAGRITARFFSEGGIVEEGDTLAIVDPENIELELIAAQAAVAVLDEKLTTAKLQVEKAKSSEQFMSSELARLTRLLGTSAANQRQVDQAQHSHEQATVARKTAVSQVSTLKAEITRARADIDRLKKRLADCYILAPTSGTVIEKLVELGEYVGPGKPVVKIAQLDTVWVKAYLPTAQFANIKLGDTASVNTESGGNDYTGTVVWTSSEAEFTPKNVQTEQSRADLVYAVKVSIPNLDGSLKIGMPVFVSFDQP